MKQILVQLDDRLAAELEKVAPGRSHKRSAFVRRALTRALHEELERRTRAAYEKWPDEHVEVDAREWAPDAEAMHPAEDGRAVGAAARVKSKPIGEARSRPRRRAARRR